MVTQLIVHPASRPLHGSVPGAPDGAIASLHMAVAAMAHGTSSLPLPFVPGEVRALVAGLRALGVGVDVAEQSGGVTVIVHGEGLDGLRAPEHVLDVRGSRWAASLLAALVASRPFDSALIVDRALADQIVPVLSSYGVRREAFVDAASLRGPRTTRGAGAEQLLFPGSEERAEGIGVAIPGIHPTPKWVALLSGLRASTPTVVREALLSPDHLERLLVQLRIPIHVEGAAVQVHPPRDLDAIEAFEHEWVGDFSLSAYLLAAAQLVAGSHVSIRNTGLNPTRTGLLDALRMIGARAGIAPRAEAGAEPLGELISMGRGALVGGEPVEPLKGGIISGELATRLGDDFIPLTLLGCAAVDGLELRDLVPTDSQLVARIVGVLRSFGVNAEPLAGGLRLRAEMPLRHTEITTGGDHRLALSAAVLALVADGPSVIDDVDCLRDHFPRFVGTLRALGAEVEVRSVD